MAITPTDFDKIWSTNASTPEYTFSDADYLEGWDFVGNLPPTRAQWNAIQKRTDEKMKYVFDHFGSPLVASTVAEMTLQNRVYVYTGSETGYTAGDWYYWNGSAWTDGGVYNAVAIGTDTTLTQAGVPADAKATGDAISAKADAKATGDAIANTQTEMSLFGVDDLLWEFETGNSSTYNGITYVANRQTKSVSVSGTATGFSFFRLYNNTSELPSGITAGETYIAELDTDMDCNLQIYPYISGNLGPILASTNKQQLFTVPSNATGLMVRLSVSKDVTVSGVVRPLISKVFSLRGLCDGAGLVNWGLLANNSDADNYTTTGFYTLESSSTYSNVPLPSKTSYGLLTIYSLTRDQVVQTVEYILTQERFYRTCSSGVWSEWKPSAQSSVLPANTDLDNLEFAGTWLLSNGYNYANAPITDSQAGLLRSYRQEGSTRYTVMQIVYGYGAVRNIYRRNIVKGGSWSEWVEIGGGTTYNNTYEFNEYQSTNTYTVTPTITTDTHNYLSSTGDTTDRKGAIETLLSTNGICHLAPGVFYVSGIDMPEYTKLTGCGNATKVVLLGDDTDEGYAVKMSTGCTVSDMMIAGNTEDHTSNSSAYPSASGYVQRHGILWQGNASGDNDQIPRRGSVFNCYICNFTGGGITGYDSGMNVISGMNVSDCYIWYCHSGINMLYLTEFSKFTNVSANRCHYGCVANGGNLMFVNCNFSLNICGLLMDDGTGQSPNNSHGSFIGCIFDHSDGNAGYAMMLYGLDHGEIFSGCQVFFGKTLIDDCKGVRFVGGNYGRQTDITINDSSAVTYDSCQFRASSETQVHLTGNTGVFFNNCLLYEGTVFNPV